MTQCAEMQKPEQKPKQHLLLPSSSCISVLVLQLQACIRNARDLNWECLSNMYKYKMLAAYKYGL